MRPRNALPALLLSTLCAAAQAGLSDAAFEPLGNLGGFPPESIAWGISAFGGVIVGESSSLLAGDNAEAFRRAPGGPLAGLGTLSDVFPQSFAYGVSGDGRFTTGASFADGSFLLQAFRHDATTGQLTALGGLPGAPANSAGYAINVDGSILVGQAKVSHAGAFRDQAMRWRSGLGMQALGVLSGDLSSVAYGVSADGLTVVGQSTNLADRAEAFVWRAPGPMVGLGDLPGGGMQSVATAVSADGRTIVGQASDDAGLVAFRYNPAYGMQNLGDLPGGAVNAQARAVSAAGDVVVGYATTADSGPDGEAFVWDYRGLRSLREALTVAGLDLTGWRLLWANGLSADGQTIVGYGRNPEGRLQAFRAVLPYCPVDYNADFVVNQEDLTGFITCWVGQVEGFGPCSAGDANADAVVDQEDLSIFVTGYFNLTSECEN